MTWQNNVKKMQSFIFGGETGNTYEDIQAQRALADQMQQRVAGSAPSTFGEGLSAIGSAIAYRRANNKASKGEAAGRETFNNDFNDLMSSYSTPSFNPSQTGSNPYQANSGQSEQGSVDLRSGILQTAESLGVDPVDLATAISYETAGTFDPAKNGPTTQWGQHKGLIQFGGPQREKYGVDLSSAEAALSSQLGANGAVAKYLRDTGVKPGMGLLDIYSAINAGGVGRYNRSDANNGGAPGTVRDKVEKQMAGHRRKAAQLLGTDFSAPAQPSSPYTPQQRAQNSRMAQQNQFDPRMLELMSNPYATQGQKAFMQLMMQKQMQGSDPMRQMQLQKMELELQQMQNPQVDPMRQIQLEKAQLELQQMQNPDRQTVKGADGYLYYQDNGERVLPGVIAAPKSNGVNVTVNNAGDTPQVPAYPKAPTGYMYIRDPQGNVMINDQGVAEMAPIIGGPNDHTAKDQINQDNQQRSGDVVIEDIGRVLDMMDSSSLPTTGLVGSASSIVPGTAAHDTSKLLDTIKANVGFDRLQQMRDASPTGGALGQVSELELRLLNSALGSLEQSQSSGQFERNLVRLRDIYHNILHVGIKDSQDIQAYEPPKPPTQETSTSETQSAEPEYGTPEWALWYMQQNGGQ